MKYKKSVNLLKTTSTLPISSGFTLIELIIVIVIIGILSGVLISVINPVRIYNKGKYAKVQADMSKFASAVEIARLNTGLTLREITGRYCTEGACRNAGDLRGTTGSCYEMWIASRDAVQDAADGQVDLSSIDRDPWESPYLLDENEGEYAIDPCRQDVISTAGSDGSYDGSVQDGEWYSTSDTNNLSIPLYSCQ